MSRGARVVVLSAVTLVALAVRVVGLTGESLWLDEVTTVVARTGMPVRTLVATAAQSSPHPPLYFVALDAWFDVFGLSPFTARLFSVVAGVAAVPVAYLVGRELFDGTTGLVAALFLALSPFHIQYSREARMYALMTFLALMSFYYFVRYVHGERTWATRGGYVLATTLLLYTHIYGVFVVLAQSTHLAMLWVHRDRTTRPRARDWVPLQAIVGLGALPWLYVLREDLRSLFLGGGGGSSLVGWLPAPSPSLLLDTTLAYTGYVTNYPFGADDVYSRTVSIGVAVILLMLLWLGFLGYREETGEYDLQEYLRRYRLLMLWLVAVLVVPYLVAEYVFPVYYPRYTIAALPALYLLAGRGVSSVSSSHLRWAAVLFVSLGLLTGTAVYHTTPTDGNWRGAGDHLDEEVQEGALVLVSPAFADRPVEYYSDRTDVNVAPLTAGSVPANGTNESFWVVTSTAYEYDEATLDGLNESYELSGREVFGTVRVYRYEPPPGGGRESPDSDGTNASAGSNRTVVSDSYQMSRTSDGVVRGNSYQYVRNTGQSREDRWQQTER